MSDVKSVSVIIASIVGPPFLDECLMSLEKQARELDAEVLVIACGDTQFAERIALKFPWTKVIHRPTRESVPDLRRHVWKRPMAIWSPSSRNTAWRRRTG